MALSFCWLVSIFGFGSVWLEAAKQSCFHSKGGFNCFLKMPPVLCGPWAWPGRCSFLIIFFFFLVFCCFLAGNPFFRPRSALPGKSNLYLSGRSDRHTLVLHALYNLQYVPNQVYIYLFEAWAQVTKKREERKEAEERLMMSPWLFSQAATFKGTTRGSEGEP